MKNPQLKPEIAEAFDDLLTSFQKVFFQEGPEIQLTRAERIANRVFYTIYDVPKAVVYWIVFFLGAFVAGVIDGAKGAVNAVNDRRDDQP